MNLAEALDVEAALGRELTSPEQTRVSGLLPEASDAVFAWCGQEWADLTLVPGAVTRVTARIVARVIASGQDVTNVTAQTTVYGPFQEQHTFNPDSTSGGPWLTAADKLRLRPFRRRSYVQNFPTH